MQSAQISLADQTHVTHGWRGICRSLGTGTPGNVCVEIAASTRKEVVLHKSGHGWLDVSLCAFSDFLFAGREDSPPVFSSGLTHDQVWNYSCRWVCLRSSHVRDARWCAASVLCSLTPAPSATSSAFTETAEGLQSAHASRSLFGAGIVGSTARAQNESETASLQPLPPPVAQVRGSKSQGLLAPRQHDDTIPVSVNEDVGITW